MKFKIIVSFLFVYSLVTPAAAQPDWNFSRLDVQAGLSDSRVSAIYRDAKGFLWVGTNVGLNRYDGAGFKNFYADPGDSLALIHNDIERIGEDPRGRLWIFTRVGTNVYDPATEKFYRELTPFLREYSLKSANVNKIWNDGDGNYFFIQGDSGVVKYSQTSRKSISIQHDQKDSSSIDASPVNDIKKDPKGYYWLVHANGVIEKLHPDSNIVVERYNQLYNEKSKSERYDLEVDSDLNLWMCAYPNIGIYHLNTDTKELNHFHKTSAKGRLTTNVIRGIVSDNNENIWVATDHGGINVMDKATFQVNYIQYASNNPNGLSDNSINCMYKDDQGIIWIGTAKRGINYYHEHLLNISLVRHPGDLTKDLNINDTNCFEEEKEGLMWVGSNEGGLSLYNRKENKFTYFNTSGNSISLPKVIVSLKKDHENNLWIGTFFGGLFKYDGKKLTQYKHSLEQSESISSDHIWAICQTSDDRLWIGTNGGGLNLFDPQKEVFYHFRAGRANSIYNDFITCLFEDTEKNLWVGTTYGIDVLEKNSNLFTHYLSSNKPGTIISNSVVCMLQDRRGMFWIGTKEGLSILDSKRVSIQNITMADGLPTNSIVSILEDEKGNIWLGTSKGLVNVIVEQSGPSSITYKLNTYTEKNGLQGRLFNDNAAFKTDSGDLVFGGPNGFNIIKPNEMKFDHSGSKIVFTQLQIFNKEVKPGDHLNNRPVLTRSMVDTKEIVLKTHENVFSLSFATLNYLEPEDVKYFYKLEGFNNDWIILDRSRENEISYTNLSPGEYVLKVKSEDNEETAKQWAEIQITILPPFWKTKYAFVGYFLIILIVLWVARKMIISRAKLKFALEEEKKEAVRVHQMDMMKIKFFTNISHEFRTPLSLILSPIERILEKEDNEDSRKQFFLIQRNAKRLMNLVNQLLDFRKIEVQEIKLALTENDIVSFARETCASFSDLSEKKNIDLSFYSKPLKLITMFDRDKLERIIFNLLSNAFKFTPEGGRISVVLEFEENAVLPNTQTGSLVKLTIKDTGIGIPEDKKEKIFDRFFQNSSPENIVNQGSGIGLSITKEFVQLHGGKIYVESGTEGSSFVVLLPVELSSTNVNAKTDESHFSFKQDELSLQEQTSKFDDKKQKLLIVEDNEDFRFYLKDNLKEEFNILEAANGDQGYRIATLQPPDLIVSDVIMPKLDGFQMTKKIRNDLRTNHIPIILLTSSSKEEQMIEGFNNGASEYLTKPFNYKLLLSRIKSLINEREMVKKSLQKKMDISPSEIDITPLDEKLISRAVKLVEKNISNADFSVEEMGRELGISRTHLYKKMVALTGKSPVEFIRLIRIKRASQLLEKSQLTVSEVSNEVGINNLKFFAKYFKAEYNMLPSQYMKKFKSS